MVGNFWFCPTPRFGTSRKSQEITGKSCDFRVPAHHIHRQPGRVRRLSSRGTVCLARIMVLGGAGAGGGRFFQQGQKSQDFQILGFPGTSGNWLGRVRKNGRCEPVVFSVAAPDLIPGYLQRRRLRSIWRPSDGVIPAYFFCRNSQDFLWFPGN